MNITVHKLIEHFYMTLQQSHWCSGTMKWCTKNQSCQGWTDLFLCKHFLGCWPCEWKRSIVLTALFKISLCVSPQIVCKCIHELMILLTYWRWKNVCQSWEKISLLPLEAVKSMATVKFIWVLKKTDTSKSEQKLWKNVVISFPI